MIKIPGGTSLDKLAFNYDGDQIKKIKLLDHKDGSSWSLPLKIGELVIQSANSGPHVYFKNEHQVENLKVNGHSVICNFEKLKISAMDFEVVFGSLSILQNKQFSENKITVKTPHGTHCIAGETINTVDSLCPDQETRDKGITNTFIDTSIYCLSELYVCSNSSTICPTSGSAIFPGQGEFKITLDDGPVQFLIDSSTTTASLTYSPTFDTFSVVSQNKLRKNKKEFSDEPNNPRTYIYEIISPNYARTWVHMHLKQYLQIRPWIISMLSLGFLSPEYHRDTLIHIPNGTCPQMASASDVSNTYISEKIKELSFIESKHVVAEVTKSNYYSYEITADNEFKKEEISFLDGNLFIIV